MPSDEEIEERRDTFVWDAAEDLEWDEPEEGE